MWCHRVVTPNDAVKFVHSRRSLEKSHFKMSVRGIVKPFLYSYICHDILSIATIRWIHLNSHTSILYLVSKKDIIKIEGKNSQIRLWYIFVNCVGLEPIYFNIALLFFYVPSIHPPSTPWKFKNEFGMLLLRHTGNTVQIITSATTGSSY